MFECVDAPAAITCAAAVIDDDIAHAFANCAVGVSDDDDGADELNGEGRAERGPSSRAETQGGREVQRNS